MRLIDADKLMLSLNDNYLANSPTWNETLEIRDYRESMCEGLEIAMATVEGAPTVSGWISIRDRLPKPEEKVLIYTKTGCLKYAQYHDEPNVMNPWYVYEDNARAWTNVISHWMPLPSTEGLDET